VHCARHAGQIHDLQKKHTPNPLIAVYDEPRAKGTLRRQRRTAYLSRTPVLEFQGSQGRPSYRIAVPRPPSIDGDPSPLGVRAFRKSPNKAVCCSIFIFRLAAKTPGQEVSVGTGRHAPRLLAKPVGR